MSTNFYPHDYNGIFDNVPEVTFDQFLRVDDGEIISAEIAQRSEDALIRNVFRESQQTIPGALFYNQLTQDQLDSIGQAAERKPGEEFALVFTPERDLKSEEVHQFGAKSEVTNEQIKRNDKDALNRLLYFLTLTIVRKLDDYVLDIFTKADAAGLTPKSAVPVLDGTTSRDTAPSATSLGHLIEHIALGQEGNLALNYNMLIMRPTDAAKLRVEERVTGLSLLDDFGVELRTSRSLTEKSAYLIDTNRAGEVLWEDPLTTEVIDEKLRHVQVVQAWATPAAAITTPSAINKITFNMPRGA